LAGEASLTGRPIYYKGNKWTVVGITAPKGNVFGRSGDEFVWVPLGTGERLLGGRRPDPEIRVEVEDPSRYERALSQAILVMRRIRGLRPGQPDNFGISESREAVEELRNTSRTLRIMAFVIGLITIFASSVALMNIMLVNVAEKFREIGIRKAVGASARQIRRHFLVETVLIALGGSLPGLLLGILAGWGVAALLGMHFRMPWNAVMWAIIITFVTALLAGWYPAYKAAKANLVEVLRYE
ncbi:MAG: FtsX-like permease family protein, partial [Chlorobi bacterium]|nr:FtsX-like permease family protein [Chlorobiota bacterium]